MIRIVFPATISEQIKLILDTSHWQDWDEDGIKQAYERFKMMMPNSTPAAFIKQSQGESPDPRGILYLMHFREAGFDTSPYHFYDTRTPWAKQADYFLHRLDKTNAYNLSCMLDLEQVPGLPAPTNMYAEYALSWLYRLKEATGAPPYLYSNLSWLMTHICKYAEFAEFPLFIAGWPADPRKPLGAPSYVPLPWLHWSAWQKSANGNRQARIFGVNATASAALDLGEMRFSYYLPVRSIDSDYLAWTMMDQDDDVLNVLNVPNVLTLTNYKPEE